MEPALKLGLSGLTACFSRFWAQQVSTETEVFDGISDPATLEASALREVMALAEDLHIQALHVATNCKGVVEDIKQKNSPNYGAIIREIVDYSRSFHSCNFVHEFRSSNVEAHNLAKHVLRLGICRHVWLGNPGDLQFVPVNIVTV